MPPTALPGPAMQGQRYYCRAGHFSDQRQQRKKGDQHPWRRRDRERACNVLDPHELLSHTLAHFPIIDPAWWCRKCWLHDQRHEPRQYRRRPSRSYRAGVHVFEYGCHVRPRQRLCFSVLGYDRERVQESEIGPNNVGQTVSGLARCRPSLGCTSPHRLLPMLFPL